MDYRLQALWDKAKVLSEAPEANRDVETLFAQLVIEGTMPIIVTKINHLKDPEHNDDHPAELDLVWLMKEYVGAL
jgi:hypothetical protein